jgi:hypothetical protein
MVTDTLIRPLSDGYDPSFGKPPLSDHGPSKATAGRSPHSRALPTPVLRRAKAEREN